jgi:hypothetical protein
MNKKTNKPEKLDFFNTISKNYRRYFIKKKGSV